MTHEANPMPENGEPNPKRTRGGNHDQHVHAGKKGGSRIRELIELGYKYEEEHGIGPGRSDRSKLNKRPKPAETVAEVGEPSSPSER